MRKIPAEMGTDPSSPAFCGLRGKTAALGAVFLVLSLGLLPSCSSNEVKQEARTSQKPLIWPSPPEPARISYVKSIEKPEDIGVKKGFFQRIAEFVLGPKSEEMVKPLGIAVDSKGRIIVVDTPIKRVHIYDVKNASYSYIEESAGKFAIESPIAAAVDADDNIYFTDSASGKVFVFNSKGKFLFDIDAGKRPTGIAINKQDKTLYIVDTGSHNIRVHDLKGTFIKTMGKWGNGIGEFNYPVDIFLDKNGDVFVTDTMNYRVQIFDKTGKFLSKFGSHGDGSGNFGRPKGIAVDKEGNIYVADALFDTVQIFDRKGTYLLSFGSIGREPGLFWMPSGVFIDNGDKIYVADSYNKRIQIFEFLGNG